MKTGSPYERASDMGASYHPLCRIMNGDGGVGGEDGTGDAEIWHQHQRKEE